MSIEKYIDKKIEQKLRERNIREEVDEKVKVVKEKRVFELPFFLKAKSKSVAKKNKILVFYIKTNKVVIPKFGTFEKGFVKIADEHGKDIYYNGNQCFVLLWKNKIPMMIIKEWDINPVGVGSKRNIDAQIITIRAIEARESEQKGGFNPMIIWIILGLVVAAAVGYYFLKGG